MLLPLVLALRIVVGGDSVLDRHRAFPGFSLEYAAADSEAALGVARAVGRGRGVVERFFGGRFRRPFVVRVYPGRAALTAHWAAAWRVPDLKTECWMVASGVADELAVLSPAAWDRDACEHSAADHGATDRLIWHEVVHVFHGQRNPRPTFDGLDDLGWFVEGVAVLASGQLAAEHRDKAREAIAAGKAPAHLATAWSGPWRYGVSGSMVGFVDRTRGRRVVTAMLADTSNVALLARVRRSEKQLLAGWRRSP